MKILKHTSIRTVLITAMIVIVTLTAVSLGTVGVLSIMHDFSNEAQDRVNHDLDSVRSQYQDWLQMMADRIEVVASLISPDEDGLSRRLDSLRVKQELDILNICTLSGQPLAGSLPDNDYRIPISSDALIAAAISDNGAYGTILLNKTRLEMEGGIALSQALVVNSDDNEQFDSALFWWAAYPLKNAVGETVAVIYGGRTLNHNYDLVDHLQEIVFGQRTYKEKPLGTVTIFLDGLRITTNVIGPDGLRAIGTKVSDEVRQQVLEQGEIWQAKALVVDAWYLSAYEPLTDPSGSIIGMLYVGILEAPYLDLLLSTVARLAIMLLIGAVISLVISVFLVGRITAPLAKLSIAAKDIAGGDLQQRVEEPETYKEIRLLSHSFNDMQEALASRDEKLHRRNDQLEKANRNYMGTLGFVTHELKSPLAAIQTMIDVIIQAYDEEIPEKASDFLRRIRHNCEELQDMVKNYLDLSRAERGELEVNFDEVLLYKYVIEPCVTQVKPLLDTRKMNFSFLCEKNQNIVADAELMRIAVTNLLSNAAKYGKENAKVTLNVKTENQQIAISVWNEGEGFTPEEGEKLFTKFIRLKNRNTRSKRGSGLGLFLCKQVAELHGGSIKAESEPGQWARFIITIPEKPPN